VNTVLVHGVAAAAGGLQLTTPGARCIEHGEIAALVTDTEASGMRAASALRLHWRVLEEAAAAATVLPVRFGTAMAGDGAVVEELLAPRHDELVAALGRLSGKVQITVKGEFDQDRLMRGVVSASPAIARLRERVSGVSPAAAYYDRIRLGQLIAEEVDHARERCTARVLERLEPLAAAVSPEQAAGMDAAVNAAFLLEKKDEPEFKLAVDELQREFGDAVQLRCVGPLPPYSFSDVGAEPAWA
jgi:hypothetical protein